MNGDFRFKMKLLALIIGASVFFSGCSGTAPAMDKAAAEKTDTASSDFAEESNRAAVDVGYSDPIEDGDAAIDVKGQENKENDAAAKPDEHLPEEKELTEGNTSEDNTSEDNTSKSETSKDNASEGNISDDNKSDDNISNDEQTAVEDANDILVFRDVFGVEYETKINKDVPKIKYDKDGFIHDGYKLSYENKSYLLGVDVSHHQGYIDWQKVKDDGYDFAILRIGYRGYGKTGSLNRDRTFEDNYKNAKKAGIKVGVYFFAQAINEEEAAEEAEYVLGILNDRELELPVVYDPESILDYEARTDDVTMEQFTANTKIFCQKIKDNGYEPMIYSNMLWEAFKLDLAQLTDFPLWYADYEEKPQTPYDFDIWQYACDGIVDGISGPTDLDIWITGN